MKKQTIECYEDLRCPGRREITAVGGDSYDNDFNDCAITDQLPLENADRDRDSMHQLKAVATNNLLLRYIFKHADFEDLKSCRRVNPLWNSEATKILRQNYLTKPIHLSMPTSQPSSSDSNISPKAETLWEASFYLDHFGIPCSSSSCCTMWDSKHKQGTLQAFTDLVEMSMSMSMSISKSKINLFPCNQFHLVSIQILEVENFQKLIRFHGEHIKSLHLSLDSFQQSQLKKLEVLLRNQLPNLEYLLLMEMTPRTWDDDNSNFQFQLFPESESEIGNKLIMQKLKTLTIDMDYQHPFSKVFLLNILKVAKNLETLNHNWRYDWKNIEANLTLLLELDVVHLLKNFTFHFNDFKDKPSRFELYTKFVKKIQTLEKIEIMNLYEGTITSQESLIQVGELLSQCFASNADTLKNIKSYCLPFGLLPGWPWQKQLPFLPNLTEFEYIDECEYNGWIWTGTLDPSLPQGEGEGERENETLRTSTSSRSIFPRGSNLSEKWPNLNSVTILLDLGSQCQCYMLRSNVMFGADVFPHKLVKKFKVSFKYREIHGVGTEWVEYFCKLFPYLTEADFSSLADFSSSCQHIWKLAYLEDLTLGFGVDPVSVNEKIPVSPCVEAGFTGFTSNTCKELFENKDKILKISVEDVNNLRVNPSILDLKHLKRLKVNATCNVYYWNPNRESNSDHSDSETEEENDEDIDSSFVTTDGQQRNDPEGNDNNDPATGTDTATADKVEDSDTNEGGNIVTQNGKAGTNTNESQNRQFGGESTAVAEGVKKGLMKETAVDSDLDDEDEGNKSVRNESGIRVKSEPVDSDNDAGEDDGDGDDDDCIISDVTKLLAFGICPMLKPEFISFTIN